MTPDRPRHHETSSRLHLVDGAPAWRARHGNALVRYTPTARPDTAALLLSGEFDAETVGCLREALDAVRTPQIERVLLDLAGIGFGDSALVHALTDTRRRPEKHILLGPLTRQFSRVLDLTDSRRRLDIAFDDAA
ncbi:STAS domain-containing protein [Streptomyces sp. NPDC056503]|uniref:STAS domain-containing protein n=1 Tax=Streptomyces sp. NPDC056503 TaxID=3345842 RepID=UPI00369E9DDA